MGLLPSAQPTTWRIKEWEVPGTVEHAGWAYVPCLDTERRSKASMKLKEGAQLFNHNRSDVQVAADMLRVRGSQTAIMYGANLNYHQTMKYLHQLSKMALIEPVEIRNGRPLYGPTGKGIEFVELVDQMEALSGIPG